MEESRENVTLHHDDIVVAFLKMPKRFSILLCALPDVDSVPLVRIPQHAILVATVIGPLDSWVGIGWSQDRRNTLAETKVGGKVAEK